MAAIFLSALFTAVAALASAYAAVQAQAQVTISRAALNTANANPEFLAYMDGFRTFCRETSSLFSELPSGHGSTFMFKPGIPENLPIALEPDQLGSSKREVLDKLQKMRKAYDAVAPRVENLNLFIDDDAGEQLLQFNAQIQEYLLMPLISSMEKILAPGFLPERPDIDRGHFDLLEAKMIYTSVVKLQAICDEMEAGLPRWYKGRFDNPRMLPLREINVIFE